jgi:hypothetical protein
MVDINKQFYPAGEITTNAHILDTAKVMAAVLTKYELRRCVSKEISVSSGFVAAYGQSSRHLDDLIDQQAEIMGIDLSMHSGSSWAMSLWTTWQLVVNGDLQCKSG